MQFWSTELGNFHDDFMFLIKWRYFHTKIGKFPDDWLKEIHNFYQVDILHFLDTLWKNWWYQSTQHAFFLARSNNNPKITENWQKFCGGNGMLSAYPTSAPLLHLLISSVCIKSSYPIDACLLSLPIVCIVELA